MGAVLTLAYDRDALHRRRAAASRDVAAAMRDAEQDLSDDEGYGGWFGRWAAILEDRALDPRDPEES